MPIKMSREEIRAIYRQGEEAIIALVEMLIERLNVLEQKVERLDAQISKDSHNSSKPSSSDWQRPAPKSLRTKSGRKSGGQPGHEGHSLKQVEKPHCTIKQSLSGTCDCGRDLAKAKKIGMEKRQVFDMPKKIGLEVTEYQGEIAECACGRQHIAEFPAGVEAPVQYGQRIRATVAYYSAYQLLPQKRITEAMKDLYGVPLSEGAVNTILKTAHERLFATEEAIKAAIRASRVVHADETGMYVNGKRMWEHTLGTELYTYYFCHSRRGKKALREDATLSDFIGRLVHDGWMSYYDLDCLHALCNAHHLRELVFVGEQGRHQRWASTMIKLFCHIKKVVDRAKVAGRPCLAAQTLTKYRERYEALLARGYKANPLPVSVKALKKRGRKKQTPARNLLDHLANHSDETLAFMYEFNVPFDNNTSERDLRMTKVKQKVSGCFRSLVGAQIFCRVRGYISTVRKHGLNVFDQLIKCFDPACNQPVLLPQECE
jgi:transposase